MMEQNILGLRACEGRIAHSAEEWRALSWSEIVARLTAARDLRRVMAHAAPALPGSFAPASARRLAARQDGIRVVNPNDLGNRKAGEATIAGIVEERSPAS